MKRRYLAAIPFGALALLLFFAPGAFADATDLQQCH